MDKIRIKGGVPLEGVIPIGGAKNAALPLMAVSLLTPDTLTLTNVPDLADIATMANLLVQHGVTAGLTRPAEMAGEYSNCRPRILLRRQPLTISSERCGLPFSCSDRCWRAADERECPCPAAARSGRDRSISTSRAAAAGRRGRAPRRLYQRGAPKGLKGAEIAFPAVSVERPRTC